MAIVEAGDCPEPTALPFGLTIAPLGHQQIDRLTKLRPSAYHGGFRSLSAALERALAAASEPDDFNPIRPQIIRF